MLWLHSTFAMERFFWRHVLGTNDVVDGIGISLGRYVITLSSGGSILRAWNLPDRQMIWGSLPFRDQRNQRHLHSISSIGGEILWRKDLASDIIEVNHIIQSLEVIYVASFVGSSTFYMYDLNTKNGELLIV
ncbi:hypothetical protein KIW84_062521 [Lathyrus oleraceus]|uniref:EMC1 first beta-propeller domain-containing protein n=1 Tax=Pisum sativum TaxID=3888 RepID=A0A9D4W5G0_PEA|nr:hypothetical protein KIW84_062521 [Pisum sativum]